MRPYFFQTPRWIQQTFNQCVWKADPTDKAIYLTFDDGPDAEATTFVLRQLSKYGAHATFFCVGKNLKTNHYVARAILQAGHALGNHTFQHLNGWKTATATYLTDYQRCQEALQEMGVSSNLFRPPYGRITPAQLQALPQGTRVVMWSHLSGDFDPNVFPSKAINSLLKAEAGSILLFHDSLKALPNLKIMLPVVLEHFSNLGFQFKKLS